MFADAGQSYLHNATTVGVATGGSRFNRIIQGLYDKFLAIAAGSESIQ